MNKKETICNSCGCESPRLIHKLRYIDKVERLCTSCVLFACKEYYCPTCFRVHDKIPEGKLVICERCKSKSHQECFSSKPNPCDSKFCSSCIDPERLIFAPMELRKPKGVKVMNLDASLLLLTAAKIGCMVVCGAWEAKKYYAVVKVYEAVVDREKATLGVNRAMRDADLKNKNVESLFDSSDTDTDMDTDTDTDDDVGRMQKLTIEGGDVFDLNKECAQGE